MISPCLPSRPQYPMIFLLDPCVRLESWSHWIHIDIESDPLNSASKQASLSMLLADYASASWKSLGSLFSWQRKIRPATRSNQSCRSPWTCQLHSMAFHTSASKHPLISGENVRLIIQKPSGVPKLTNHCFLFNVQYNPKTSQPRSAACVDVHTGRAGGLWKTQNTGLDQCVMCLN